MKIGNRIREYRERKNLSQENMAEELNMSINGYGKIERNEVDINIERLCQIAKTLDVAPEDLLKTDSISINNYGDVKGHQYVHNIHFPLEMKQLYEDKIKLLESIIEMQKGEIDRLKETL